jgi:hypothetical protein
MRRLEIGRRKRSAQAVRGDHLVRPIEPLEMVLVESARFRCPHGGEYAGLIPGKNGSVRYVRKAGDRQGSRPVVPPWVWTSTDMEFRRTSSAAAAVSAVWAAAVEPRRSKPPPTIAATEVSVLHIQRRRVSA